jgi:orotate phosphoribosyltransferase
MDIVDEIRRLEWLASEDTSRFLRRGHFVYESGDHGDTWLALDLLFADPHRLQRAAARLAARLRGHAPEVVCGPLVGGALLAQWVAHELNTAFVYAIPHGGPAPSRPRYIIPPDLAPLLAGKRAVVVDDAINAGWASRECLREVERHRGSVAAVAALLVRDPRPAELQGAVVSLVDLPFNIWPATGCPLCRSGLPVNRVNEPAPAAPMALTPHDSSAQT